MIDLRYKKKYFRMITAGKKDLECRLNYPFIKKIKVGSAVRFFWEKEKYDVKILAIRKYKTFSEMLNNEDASRLVPGMSKEKALREYNTIYPNWKIKKFGGVIVLEFAPI